MPIYYATSGSDTLAFGENYRVYAYGGNDHVTVGRDGWVIADTGNDTMVAAGDDVTLEGQGGSDTYIVDWQGSFAYGNSAYRTIIDEDIYWDSANDVLDLSRVADSIDQILISGSTETDARIQIFDENGILKGTVWIDNDSSINSLEIEQIKIGATTYDISSATSGVDAYSLMRYGVTSGQNVINLARDGEAVTGMRGNDIISSDGHSNVSLYGGGENDTLSASYTNQSPHIDDFDSYYSGVMNLYGEAGNDTLIVSGSNARLDGGDGNDNLRADGFGSLMIGGAGNDTISLENFYQAAIYGGDGNDLYVLEETSRSDFFVRIDRWASTTGRDTLDISDYADSLDDISFSSNNGSDLYINILDDDGDTIGRVFLGYQVLYGNDGAEGRRPVEVLRLDGMDYVMPQSDDISEIVADLRGVTNGNDRFDNIMDQYFSGLDGNDTLNSNVADRGSLWGGNGNDSLTVNGTWGAAHGEDGNDTLVSNGSFNSLFGETGTDFLISHGENDFLYGGDGNDTIHALDTDAYVQGDAGDDLIIGVGNYHGLTGNDGADTIQATSRSNLYGGDGNDLLTANGDINFFSGGAGDDTIDATYHTYAVIASGDGDDIIYAGGANMSPDHLVDIRFANRSDLDGSDTLDMSIIETEIATIYFSDNRYDDVFIHLLDANGDEVAQISFDYGAREDDIIWLDTLIVGDTTYDLTVANSVDELNGIYVFNVTSGNDTVEVDYDYIRVNGYAGDDSLTTTGDYAVLLGSGGNDTLSSTGELDTLKGGAGNDSITGVGPRLEVFGDDGDDTIFVTSKDTVHYGESSGSTVSGGAGNDTITVNGRSHTVNGGDGNDLLSSFAIGTTTDRSMLNGGSGDDTLIAASRTNLSGGSGDDLYEISPENNDASYTVTIQDNNDVPGGSSSDTLDISDIVSDIDQLRFSGSYDSLYIRVVGDDETTRTIYIYDQFGSDADAGAIETLRIGNNDYDLTAATSGNMLNSMLIHGVTEGDDAVTVDVDNETVMGLGGADTMVAAENYISLSGGDGNDLLISEGRGSSLKGDAGDDTFVIGWNADTNDWAWSSTIEDSAGDDVLDISNLVDDISQITFASSIYGNDYYIRVRDTEGTEIGQIAIAHNLASGGDSAIETLKIGSETYDLSVASSVGELNSLYILGAGEGDDTLTVTSPGTAIYGFGGNDLMQANNAASAGTSPSDTLFGGAGDDTLHSGTSQFVYLHGESGGDTYVIDWTERIADSSIHTAIFESDAGTGDTIEFGDVADGLEDLVFMGQDGWLYINVFDAQGSRTGTVSVHTDSDTAQTIETISVGGVSYDISAYENGGDIQSKLVYGATEGDDIIVMHTRSGGSNSETLHGYGGNDTLAAGATSARVYGDEGEDILSSGGNTYVTLSGGADNDIYVVTERRVDETGDNPAWVRVEEDSSDASSTHDVLDISAIADDVSDIRFGYGGTVQIYDGETEVTRVSFGNFDAIEELRIGSTNIDLTQYADVPEEHLTSLIAYGTSDARDVITTRYDNEYIYGFGGNDVITVGANSGSIHGGDGRDYLDSGAHSYVYLYGDNGNDTLVGGSGSGNYLTGGAGDDLYIANWTTALDNGINMRITGETDGYDVLDLSNVADDISQITVAQTSYYYPQNWLITVTDANGTVQGVISISSASTGQIEMIRIGSVEITVADWSSAEELNNWIRDLTGDTASTHNGSASADEINGYGGNDVLNGMAGDDTLIGGTGADTMDGGTGRDMLDYTGSSAAVMVDLSRGRGRGGDAEGDRISNAEDIAGTAFNDTMIGTAGENRLLGGDGFDFFDGGAGADFINGGGDQDRVNYGASTTAVHVSLDTGAGYTGDAEGDVLVRIEELVGSDFNDTLEGSTGRNKFWGGDGDDLITANDGPDVLYGEAGNDTLNGGEGRDIIIGGTGDDSITGGTGNDIVETGTGSDILVYADGHGGDYITDFDVTSDTLDLTAITGIDSFADLNAEDGRMRREDGVLLHTSSGDFVFIAGVTIAEIETATIVN